MNTIWSLSAIISYTDGSWASSEARSDNGGFSTSGPNIGRLPTIHNLLVNLGISSLPSAIDDNTITDFTFRFSLVTTADGFVQVVGDTENIDILTNDITNLSSVLTADSNFKNYFGINVVNTVDTVNKPTAEFTADVVANNAGPSINVIVTFTNQSINNGVTKSHLWRFGDGVTSTQNNPTHSYTAVGAYTVTLVETNEKGSDTMIKTNYINVTNVADNEI